MKGVPGWTGLRALDDVWVWTRDRVIAELGGLLRLQPTECDAALALLPVHPGWVLADSRAVVSDARDTPWEARQQEQRQKRLEQTEKGAGGEQRSG